jgi:hypothetical protein
MNTKKLFKYYSVNSNSISALANEFVWYANAGSFNDPFDTRIIENDLLQQLSFSKEKILCLSEVNDNILMWSHYANSHKGFCVEYTDYSDEEIQYLKTKRLFPNQKNSKLTIIRNAKPVKYKTTQEINAIIKDIPQNDKHFLSLYNSLDKEKQKQLVEKIQTTSFIKHIDWSYEKEYRIINTSKNTISFPGKLTAIYFGMNMSGAHKRMIGKIVDPNLDKGITFYQMYRERGSYNLQYRFFDKSTDFKELADSIVF